MLWRVEVQGYRPREASRRRDGLAAEMGILTIRRFDRSERDRSGEERIGGAAALAGRSARARPSSSVVVNKSASKRYGSGSTGGDPGFAHSTGSPPVCTSNLLKSLRSCNFVGVKASAGNALSVGVRRRHPAKQSFGPPSCIPLPVGCTSGAEGLPRPAIACLQRQHRKHSVLSLRGNQSSVAVILLRGGATSRCGSPPSLRIALALLRPPPL